jgi:hypothetical protein
MTNRVVWVAESPERVIVQMAGTGCPVRNGLGEHG